MKDENGRPVKWLYQLFDCVPRYYIDLFVYYLKKIAIIALIVLAIIALIKLIAQ